MPQANTGVNAPQEAAPAQLVSEVFDCLLEAGRSELAGLLAVLLKASSKSALEAVRDAAIKRGVMVAANSKPSRFQQCSHAQLDSFFSCVEQRDLRVADVVCRRWRSACVYSNAGWISALSRRAIADESWLRELKSRHIAPAKLTDLRVLTVHSDHTRAFPVVGKLPRLTELTVLKNLSATQIQQLGSLTTLRKLTVSAHKLQPDPFDEDDDGGHFDAADLLVAASFAKTLTSLDLSGMSGLPVECRILMSLPSLTSLKTPLFAREEDDLSFEHKITSTSLTTLDIQGRAGLKNLLEDVRLPALTTLIAASGFEEEDWPIIAGLTSLTSLRGAHDAPLIEEDLKTISTLTHLTSLKVQLCQLQPLTVFTQLQSISLHITSNEQQQATSWQQLLQPLHQLPNLTELELITEREPATGIFSGLPPSLQSLTLDYTILKGGKRELPLELVDELNGTRSLKTFKTNADNKAAVHSRVKELQLDLMVVEMPGHWTRKSEQVERGWWPYIGGF